MTNNGKAKIEKTFNGLNIIIPSKKNWFKPKDLEKELNATKDVKEWVGIFRKYVKNNIVGK